MEMIIDSCWWCKDAIRRSSSVYPWRDTDGDIDCIYHPISMMYTDMGVKITGKEGIHQTREEVYEIVRQDYNRNLAIKNKEPLRSIDNNVVATPKSPRRTTRMAAEKILPKTGSIRRKVYDLIRLNSGMTDYELEAELRMKHQTVSASRRSLVLDGFIIDSGRIHKNAQGNDCIVWVTTPIDGKLFA